MYLYHFGLKELPFTLTPNTQFFLGLPSHHEALQVLLTALKIGEGFIKVTGEVGTGKTLLCRKVLNELPDAFVSTYIPNPDLSPDQLRSAVATELGLKLKANQDQHQITQLIQKRLVEINATGKSVVLLLDEAQALPNDSLETLRLFTNLETENRKLLQVVLFGQPELDSKLDLPALRQIKQRISFSYRLRQLKQEEISTYLHHRMSVAGYSGMPLFPESLCKKLFQVSKGTPRLINILAHKTLMLCFGEGKREPDKTHLIKAIKDTEALTTVQVFWLAHKVKLAIAMTASVTAVIALAWRLL